MEQNVLFHPPPGSACCDNISHNGLENGLARGASSLTGGDRPSARLSVRGAARACVHLYRYLWNLRRSHLATLTLSAWRARDRAGLGDLVTRGGGRDRQARARVGGVHALVGGHVNGGSRGSWKVNKVPSESSPREDSSNAAKTQ